MNRRHHPFVALMCLALLALLAFGSAHAVDYHVKAIMQLTGAEVSTARGDQWRAVASLASQEVTSEWADSDTLVIDVVDTTGSKSVAIEAALDAMNDPSVLGIVTAGLPDDLDEELSRLLRFSNVRKKKKKKKKKAVLLSQKFRFTGRLTFLHLLFRLHQAAALLFPPRFVLLDLLPTLLDTPMCNQGPVPRP
jgi:hypothetical protein